MRKCLGEEKQKNIQFEIGKAFNQGITLVALVVTIVVLLILAGVTISYVMGDNSIFKKASEAKLKADIAQWKERLELAKSPVFIEGLGTFNPNKYFDYIQGQGIINSKDTDVIDNEDGTYDVTTKPGYVFLITLMPTPENPTDAEIEYIGEAGKIAPIIKRLDVSATSSSITGKAIVARLGKNGTVKYYYKSTAADDNTYQEITNVNAETGATQNTGITAGESYTIKVVAKNDAGEVELTKEINATKIMVESLNLDKTKMTIELTKSTTGTITATVLPENATNKSLKWTSSKESVATVSDNGVVISKSSGTTTITVETTDGSNLSKTCEVIVVNKLAESLELNSVRARIATGYTRWLTATATSTEALQEFEWTSSNTNVATVDSTGKITAKAVGTTTITVKTKDGTNLSKTCSVTVANGVDITTLTSIQSSNTVAKDSYGNLVTIPGGFKVVTSEATNVTQGIVIQDNEGNEFVWVPVDSVTKGVNVKADDIRLGRYTFDTTNGTPTKQQDADNYTRTVAIETYFQEITSSSGNTAAKNLGSFVTKTKANGGYYIGRYEASQGEDGKADSQANKAPWVSITQPNAATAARGMYSSNYVESDLINSYSWDTAIVFIQTYSGNSTYAIKHSVNTSKVNTGRTGDKACNIHDMASNCMEWSTEHSTYKPTSTGYPCIMRGGYCTNTSWSNYSPSYRRYDTTTNSGAGYSFRTLCYVK